jgi:hypothetical protein
MGDSHRSPIFINNLRKEILFKVRHMALWGTADSINSPGTISLVYATKVITGSGTSFSSAYVGSVIYIGAGNTVGEAVIDSVTNATTVSIASTQFLSGVAVAGLAYTCSQQPKYLMQDSNYDLQATSVNNTIVGVDVYETAAIRDTEYSDGDTGYKYAVTHAGWVGVHTYVDMHGNLRVKSETLVALSGITTNLPPVQGTTYGTTGDANDDSNYPDRTVDFTTQPTAVVGIATTSATTLTAFALATPYVGLSTQWQYAYPVSAGYTALSNNSIYSNVTGPILGIGSTNITSSRPNGYSFRAVVTGDGVSAESDGVTVTYA